MKSAVPREADLGTGILLNWVQCLTSTIIPRRLASPIDHTHLASVASRKILPFWRTLPSGPVLHKRYPSNRQRPFWWVSLFRADRRKDHSRRHRPIFLPHPGRRPGESRAGGAEKGLRGTLNPCAPEKTNRFGLARKLAQKLRAPEALAEPISLYDIPSMKNIPLDTNTVCSRPRQETDATFLSLEKALGTVADHWRT